MTATQTKLLAKLTAILEGSDWEIASQSTTAKGNVMIGLRKIRGGMLGDTAALVVFGVRGKIEVETYGWRTGKFQSGRMMDTWARISRLIKGYGTPAESK